MFLVAGGLVDNQETGDQRSIITTTLIFPLDESGFLNGVRLREPAAVDGLEASTLIEFGLRACELRNGYVMGSRPAPVDVLALEVADEVGGLDPDDVASAVANAARGRLCDTTVEEAP